MSAEKHCILNYKSNFNFKLKCVFNVSMLNIFRFAYFSLRYNMDDKYVIAGGSDGFVYLFSPALPHFQMVCVFFIFSCKIPPECGVVA